MSYGEIVLLGLRIILALILVLFPIAIGLFSLTLFRLFAFSKVLV